MVEQIRQWVSLPGWQYLWPPSLGVGIFIFGLALRWLILIRVQRLVSRTKWTWDDLLLAALKGPSVLWCLIAGVYVAVLGWPVSVNVQQVSSRLLSILWLLSLTLAAVRLSEQLIQRYGEKLSSALPLTSLTQNLTKGIILVLGGLMILNSLGISITPLLTALGVGGLAVALALQETLANLFAGIYVTMARQVRIGDYIKMDSGQEGVVTDIGWRSTRVRTLSNSLIVIPNTKIAQAIVTNYTLPTPEMAVLVEVGVGYGSDLEQVERVTAEVGKEVMRQVAGAAPEFDPFIRYHTFGPYSINFTVVLQGKSFVDQYLIKHEFIKKLHRRYQKEGIVIPSPPAVVA